VLEQSEQVNPLAKTSLTRHPFLPPLPATTTCDTFVFVSIYCTWRTRGHVSIAGRIALVRWKWKRPQKPKPHPLSHTYAARNSSLASFPCVLAQLRIQLLGWGWGCGVRSFFSYYSAARDAILYLFKRTLAFGCCQNRVTLCARGAAALCMRLFCGYWVSMIYGPGVCVFGMRAHGTGCLHSIFQPYLRWQVIKI